MRVRRLLAFCSICFVAAIGWVVYQATRPTDEELIRRLFISAEHGVEKERLREVMSVVSEQYTDSAGVDKERLSEIAFNAFTATWNYKVTVSNLAVQVMSKTRATAEADVVVDIFNKDGSRYGRVRGPMEYSLLKENGRWRISSSTGGHEMIVEGGFRDYLYDE